jgi:RimJ/RimL family protein N-acetyltransferase
MSDVTVKTKRLILRRLDIADAPSLHEALSDPEAMRYWSTLPHRTLRETESWIAATIAAVTAGEADDFAITQDGAVIGKAGLWRGSEFGILVARRYWRRGFAAEAARAVLARAAARGLPRVDADVDPRNTACLTLLGRLGFRRTGEAKATFQLGDEWADSVYLSFTPKLSDPVQFCGG